MPFQVTAVHSTREYDIQPRKHHRGVGLFSDVLPFGHLWYAEPNPVSNTIGYAIHSSRSHDAVIRVYDADWQRDRNSRAHGRFQRVVGFH